MKNILVIAVLVVISFVFVSRTNAEDFVTRRNLVATQTVSPTNARQPTKEELQKIAEDKSIETIKVPKGTFEPEAVPKKKTKFDTSIGLGNGYKVGDRVWGRYHFDNSSTLSIRLGYSLCKYIEFQGEYSNTKNFYRNRPLLPLEQHQRYYNYGLNLKFKVPVIIKGVAFSPYFIFGTGKATEIYEGVGAGVKFKYSGSGKYRKTGGGIEVNLGKNLFIFSEYAYYKIGLIILDVGPYQVKDRMYYSTVIGGIGLRI